MKKIKAGFAVKDISPEKPVPGRLGLNHMIKPYHPISAKAVALSNEDGNYLIISCEIVGLTKRENHAVRDIICRETELPFKNIIITGTHTHSSPWVWDVQDEEARKAGIEVLDRKWMNKVIKNTARAGINALTDMKMYDVRYGSAETEGIVSNRVDPVTRWSVCEDDVIRNAPEGIVDRTVRTISFHDDNKRPVFIFSNLACHPTALGGGKTEKVSPDYPYFAEQSLKKKYGSDLILAYWQGCAGNINSGKYNKNGTEEEARIIGKRFFESIDKALGNTINISDRIGFTYKYSKFGLPVGDFVKEPETMRSEFIKLSEEIKSKDDITEHEIFMWRRKLKQLDVSVVSGWKEMLIEFQLFRFGDTEILFVPGEWYVQMYLNLAKTRPGKNLIITTLNDFDLLYVPDESSMPNIDWYGVRTDMRSLGDEASIELFNRAAEFIS